MRRINPKIWLTMWVFLLAMACVASGDVIYVDDDAGGANDGSSWDDAFNYLQDALAEAKFGDEIRVAQGIYRPDEDIAHSSGTGDRTATFQLENGVVIKGGYAGFGQPEPDVKNPNIYETILSGDLARNDVRLENPSDLMDHWTRTENSYHVVNSIYNDETAILDGFTISGGNSNRYNVSHYHIGGGIYNRFGNCTVSNCVFIYNSAYNGGGAMRNYESSSVLTNCKFISNYTQVYGGAINNQYCNISLVNCEFIDNSTEGTGGAIWNSRCTNTLFKSSFIDNSAAIYGGGMYNTRSQINLINCKFTQNFGGHYGGGMDNYDTDLTILNCVFRRNCTDDRGGAMYTYGGNQQMVNCAFVGNYASWWGAARFTRHCAETLTNCLFVGNWADKIGAAVYSFNNTSQYNNCTFADNNAPNGSSLACEHVFGGPSDIKITNCIFWDDGDGIWNNDNSVITITYSDVQGGWPGEGNIMADPRFVQPGYFGPIAYWKLDENDGTTAYDSVGQNHGTVYGAQWTTGQIDGALDFDGVDDYVDIPYDSSLDIDASEGITLSVWVKLNSYPDSTHQGPIFGLFDSTGQGTKNYLAIGKSIYGNVITWDQWPPSGGGITSIKPDLDTWYHVAAVEDSTHKAIYINGSLDVSDTTPETYEGNLPDTIRIGCRADGWAPFYFDGKVDDVIIFDRALSDEEIIHLYESSGYRLLPVSPCINAGDPDYIAGPNETDLDGKPRIIAGRIDMGAYEFNHKPVADAGDDQDIECACNTAQSTKVTLDGSNSSDSDGGLLTYIWTGPFVESPVNGAAPTVTLEGGCPGEYVITLVVDDGIDESEPNEVVITVVDMTPPEFEFSVLPTMLWPPNHKMVEITPSWTVSDECDASPDISLVSIVANEGDDIIGDGHTTDDIQKDDDGSIFVRSERSGTNTGRIYTITYQAVDDCGNTTVRSATVGIPHEFKLLARIGERWLWRNYTGNLPEDLNGDGIVNLKDIAIFANNWIQ